MSAFVTEVVIRYKQENNKISGERAISKVGVWVKLCAGWCLSINGGSEAIGGWWPKQQNGIGGTAAIKIAFNRRLEGARPGIQRVGWVPGCWGIQHWETRDKRRGSGDGREEGERRAGENFPSGLQKKDDVMPEVGELVGRGYARCVCVYITRGTQLRQGSFLS